MALTIEALSVKDSAGVAIPGGVYFVDTVGASAGPYAAGHCLLDATGAAMAAFGTGVRGATVQRVTICTDDIVDVTGTVTANLGSVDNTVLDNIQLGTDILGTSDVPIGGGATTATTAILGGGQYNSTPITLTNLQSAALQVNASGHLIIAAGTAEVTDDTTTHTAGSTKAVNVAFVAAPTDATVDANDLAVPMMNTNRHMVVDTNGAAYQFSIAPTVTAGAYTAGDVIGTGELVITNAARVSGGGGILTGISMHEEGVAALADTIEVLIFSTEPAGSTFTDNVAVTVVDADGPFLVASVILDTLSNIGSATFLQKIGLNIAYKCAGTSLYAVPVHRGTWAPAATDGLTFNFQMIRD